MIYEIIIFICGTILTAVYFRLTNKSDRENRQFLFERVLDLRKELKALSNELDELKKANKTVTINVHKYAETRTRAKRVALETKE